MKIKNYSHLKKMIFCLIVFNAITISVNAQNKHEKVLKLIHLMRIDESIDATLKNCSEITVQNMKSGNKDSVEIKATKAMMESSFASIKTMTMNIIKTDMVALYEKYYTVEDIDSYISFYETTAGQKLIQTQPELENELMNIMMTKYLPEIMKKSDNLKMSKETKK